MRREYPNLAIEYDREANAMYIYIKEGVGAERTDDLGDFRTNVDIGPDGDVVGVEVLL